MKSPPLVLLSLLCILALVLALCGCRTSEVGTIHLTIPETMACGQLAAITITQTLYAQDIGVEQGKTIEAGASAMASLAATVKDITAAQGDAKGGDNTGPAETTLKTEPAKVPFVGADPAKKEPKPDAEPAATKPVNSDTPDGKGDGDAPGQPTESASQEDPPATGGG